MKRLNFAKHFGIRLILVMMLILPLMVGFTVTAFAAPDNSNGAVYTMTNASSGNEVLVYGRSADSTLSSPQAYSTGGLGTGASLGSQSSVVLTKDHQWLFAVNAGSNDISVFAVKKSGLDLVDVVASGGVSPISLTNDKDWLYVLNAGGSGNINGFSIGTDGSLSPLAGSTQPVSNGGIGAAPALAQISFNSDGSTLVVTEKNTNLIDTYEVVNGIASAPTTHPSAGTTPFGFAFDRQNHAIVSEAASGSLSSYEISADVFNVISPAVVNGQAAACWVAISKNGKFAYTTNAASGNISSYQISADGSLTLLSAVAASTGAGPVDMAFSINGQYLYALAGGAHIINIFQMNADGSLSAAGSISVPAGVVGLAAR